MKQSFDRSELHLGSGYLALDLKPRTFAFKSGRRSINSSTLELPAPIVYMGQLFLPTSSHYMGPGHQYTQKVRRLLYERACLQWYNLFIERKIVALDSDITERLNQVPLDSLCTYCGSRSHNRCDCTILNNYLKQVMALNRKAAEQESDIMIHLLHLEFN